MGQAGSLDQAGPPKGTGRVGHQESRSGQTGSTTGGLGSRTGQVGVSMGQGQVWQVRKQAMTAGEKAGARAGSRWDDWGVMVEHGGRLARRYAQCHLPNGSPRERVRVIMGYMHSFRDFAENAYIRARRAEGQVMTFAKVREWQG